MPMDMRRLKEIIMASKPGGKGGTGTPKVSQPIAATNGGNTQGQTSGAGHIFGVHTGGVGGKGNK